MSDTVTIYTDGACRGNPGPGGYGAILVSGSAEKVFAGGEKNTTNNRMELTAAIVALEALSRRCEVELISDSKYLIDGISKGWAQSWKDRGWKKSDGKPAINSDLWEKILRLTAFHQVTFSWVEGHAGHPFNERCDALATAYADGFRG